MKRAREALLTWGIVVPLLVAGMVIAVAPLFDVGLLATTCISFGLSILSGVSGRRLFRMHLEPYQQRIEVLLEQNARLAQAVLLLSEGEPR